MPEILIRVANIAANSEVHPFEDTRLWKYRRCPAQYLNGALYEIALISDGAAGGLTHEIKIGTSEVVQRSDTGVGGTDGVMPLLDPGPGVGANSACVHRFRANPDDEVDLVLYEEAAAATTDVMIAARVTPL
jgi:hypothetical protein